MKAGPDRGPAGSGGVPGTAPAMTRELRPCPSSPNCVSSRATDPAARMAPIPFAGPPEAAQARLVRVLREVPRGTIDREEPGYVAASFRSRLFRFVDESEFLLDAAAGVIHFRSGARAGYHDFGVNRRRMERIRAAFAAADPAGRPIRSGPGDSR